MRGRRRELVCGNLLEIDYMEEQKEMMRIWVVRGGM
jgi:hypothetical protein